MQIGLPIVAKNNIPNSKGKNINFKGYQSAFESAEELFLHVATPKESNLKIFGYTVDEAHLYVNKMWKMFEELKNKFQKDKDIKVVIDRGKHGFVKVKVDVEDKFQKTQRYRHLAKHNINKSLAEEIVGPEVLSIEKFRDNILEAADYIKTIYKNA